MIDHGLEAHLGAVGYDLGPCFIDLSWNPVVSHLFIILQFTVLFIYLCSFSYFLV